MTDPTTPENVDVLAIGGGPFNLGLAALASTVDDAEVLVVDSADRFAWHSGLMFDDAKLQVSFLSDLVSLVDPTHPLSFLAYLADVDRLYPFLVREDFFPTRREYEAYLLWVIDRVPGLRFGTTVEQVHWDEAAEHFEVVMRGPDGPATVIARHVVVGIGTAPVVPEVLQLASVAPADSASVIHSADYLPNRERVRRAGSVTVVGSGQSGAEIVADLLEANLAGGPAVRWWTRTGWFAPLDFTKLSLEMTTPAYMEYFHALPEATRDEVRKGHWQFHKGVSADTLARIHDLLYRRELHGKLPAVQLRNGVTIEGIEPIADGGLRVRGRHLDTGKLLSHNTDLVISATGYAERRPDFLAPISDRLRRDSCGRFVVETNHSVGAPGTLANRLFVANAEHHAYGVSTPNLDIGAVRNAKILNSVLGRQEYRLPRNTAFTSFGVDDDLVVE